MDLTDRLLLDPLDLRLVDALQDGLPLVSRPYAALGEPLGLTEPEVRSRIGALLANGIMGRLGVVVRHRELGYLANAMVVWDVPDPWVAEVGRLLGAQRGVNLCYRRPRRPPDWPYNLFSMIHGRDRPEVLVRLQVLIQECGLQEFDHRVLFSRRRFKQRGAHYSCAPAPQTLDLVGLEAPPCGT